MLTEFSQKAAPVCRLPTWDDGKIGRKGTNVLKEDMGKHHEEPSSTLRYIYVKPDFWNSIDIRQGRRHIKFDVKGRETVKDESTIRSICCKIARHSCKSIIHPRGVRTI